MALKKCMLCGEEKEDNRFNFVMYKIKSQGIVRGEKSSNRCKDCVNKRAREKWKTDSIRKFGKKKPKGKFQKLLFAGDDMVTCATIAEDYLKVKGFRNLEKKYGCVASSLSAFIARREKEFSEAYPELYKEFAIKRRVGKQGNKFKTAKRSKNTFDLKMLEELPSVITYFDLNNWASHINECHYSGLELVEMCKKRGITVVD